MARKRKKKARGGRRRAKRGASSPGPSKTPPAAEADSEASTDAASAEVIAEPPVKAPAEPAREPPAEAPPPQTPAETPSETAAEPPAPAPVPTGGGAEPRERMPASALAVTLPDVSEGQPEASGELWSPQRRQPEPELPAVEIHPENPDKAPVVSGVIQGFVAPEDPKARASSVLAVEFGGGEPSIQIEATYRRDTRKLLNAKKTTEAEAPEAAPPTPEAAPPTPDEPVKAEAPATPEASLPGPFNGDTEKVDVQLTHEVEQAPTTPEAVSPAGSDELPEAELDDVTEDESLPVYAVDQAEAPLIEVPEPGEPEPAPTKRSTVLDTPGQPQAGSQPGALIHPSPFPPAKDPRVKDAETPISNNEAYTAPDREPEAPVAIGPFKPAAFVDTASEAPEPPRLAGVPPLILPKKKPSEAASPAEPPPEPAPAPSPEPAPSGEPDSGAAAGALSTAAGALSTASAPPSTEPPSTAAGVVSGVIGGALAASPALAQQQQTGEPLTASGSIIIDPELIAAEQAALAQAAAEKAAAEKAAAEEAAAQEAAIAKAAAEHEAAEKAAEEKAAEEKAAEEKAAEEKAAEEKAAEEKAAEEKAAEEKAAEEKAAEEKAAEEKAAEEKAAKEKAAEEKAAEEEATEEKAAEEKAAKEKAAEEKAAEEEATEEEATEEEAAKEKAAEEEATEEKATEGTPPASGPATSLGKSMAATVRFELRETGDLPLSKKPDPPTSRPVATARRTPPTPLSKGDAFSDLEIAFFEQDLQKVEEVDTFEDLVQDLPEPETPWGRLFGKPKGKPKKRAEPTRTATEEDDRPKKVPRPPHKRK